MSLGGCSADLSDNSTRGWRSCLEPKCSAAFPKVWHLKIILGGASGDVLKFIKYLVLCIRIWLAYQTVLSRCGNPQLTPEWEQFTQSVHSEGVRHLTSPLTPRQLAGQESFAVQTGKASGAPGREWLARRGGQLTWLVWGAYFAFAGWPQPEAGAKIWEAARSWQFWAACCGARVFPGWLRRRGQSSLVYDPPGVCVHARPLRRWPRSRETESLQEK